MFSDTDEKIWSGGGGPTQFCFEVITICYLHDPKSNTDSTVFNM